MADATLEKERWGTGCGYGQVFSCLATLSTTETTAVTIPVGMTVIGNVQANWASSLNTNSSLFTTVSGTTVTLDATDAVTGTVKAYIQVFGD